MDTYLRVAPPIEFDLSESLFGVKIFQHFPVSKKDIGEKDLGGQDEEQAIEFPKKSVGEEEQATEVDKQEVLRAQMLSKGKVSGKEKEKESEHGWSAHCKRGVN